MELLRSSQHVPQPPPPPFPPLSNADDHVDFIIDVFLVIFGNPVFLFFALFMIYSLSKCFLRWIDARQTQPEPDIETGATNLEVAPSFVYDKSWAEGAGVLKGNINECVICLEDIKDGEIAKVLPECAHVFHRACIDLWFRKNMVCPICRATCYRS